MHRSGGQLVPLETYLSMTSTENDSEVEHLFGIPGKKFLAPV